MPKLTPAQTPRALGYRMPAEWAPHDAIWLSWPHDVESFGEGLPQVEDTYVRIIAAIHKSERVELFTTGPEMRKRVAERLTRAGVELARVRFHEFPYADVWFRDYGPSFVLDQTGRELGMVHWIFNAWGGKYEELKGDTRVPDFMFDPPLRAFKPGIVMEGGSIDVNGAGAVLTTEQCLLNKNRNPALSRAEIEKYLGEYLNVSKVIWLGEGIAGDDTDGHVDDIARFVSPRRVVCAVEERRGDANYAPLKDCFSALEKARDQDGNPLEVVRLPMPGPVEAAGRRLPASYANFYIDNDVVLVPVFGGKNDARALKILEPLFPGRTLAPIPCRELVHGLGTIHCISQQQPSLSKSRHDG